MELKVGDKLYYISSRDGIKEATITKIGRKYLYIGKTKVGIESLKYEDKVYSQHNKQFYKTVEDAEMYIEQEKLTSSLQVDLTYSIFFRFSLEDLKVMRNIVDKYK